VVALPVRDVSEPARESELLAWIAQRARGAGPRELPLALGPGDDAAILEVPGGPSLVVTIDLQIEDVHFRRADATPAEIGRKAMAAGLSDVAAMGARPAHAFVSAGLPPGYTTDEAHELFAGIEEIATRFSVVIAGGDTTKSPSSLVVDVAVIGVAGTNGAIRRSGARSGDRLFVTGRLGGSSAGRHLRFDPRVDEGAWLADTGHVRAMMDVSDGLSTDLLRLLTASGVGARVEAERVPISDAARELSGSSGRDELAHALDDGEDFELLFACDRDHADDLVRRWPFEVELTEFGIATEDNAVSLVGKGGRTTPLRAGGHEHTCR